MRRRLTLAAAALALAGAIAAPEGLAGRECEGLDACIRVVGPWVQVPAGEAPTYYQLRCPGRGQLVGGLDADLGGRMEITFLGVLGGPVSPGVTTGSSIVFVARSATQGAQTFRPLLGCIPASGGGRARTSYEPTRTLEQARPPAEPTIRRVTTVRLRRSPSTLTRSCRAGERLLAFSHALAFRTRTPPAESLLTSLRATSHRSGHRVVVSLRGTLLPEARVELQIHVVCAL